MLSSLVHFKPLRGMHPYKFTLKEAVVGRQQASSSSGRNAKLERCMTDRRDGCQSGGGASLQTGQRCAFGSSHCLPMTSVVLLFWTSS